MSRDMSVEPGTTRQKSKAIAGSITFGLSYTVPASATGSAARSHS